MNGTNIAQILFAGVAIIGLPGVLALVAALVGYGKLQQRLTAVEIDVAKLSDLSNSVTRIDERTKSQASDMREIKNSVVTLTDHILSGALDLIRRPPQQRN